MLLVTIKQSSALTRLNFEQFEKDIDDYRERSELVTLLNAGLDGLLTVKKRKLLLCMIR